MIYLAAYKGKTRLFDRVIQYWTNSRYSHCELVINNICYSSSYKDNGVRCKSINYTDSSKWDLYPVEWVNSDKVLEYYEQTKNYKYSVLDLIFTQLFKSTLDEEGAIYCSAWCAAALGISKPNLYNVDDLISLIGDMKCLMIK